MISLVWPQFCVIFWLILGEAKSIQGPNAGLAKSMVVSGCPNFSIYYFMEHFQVVGNILY